MCKTFTPEFDGKQYTVVQGTNRHENWSLLESSDPSDIWFHASGTPSAYVLLHGPVSGLRPPLSVVQFCSSLIDSKDVVWTNCGNLKKGKSAGQAIVLDEALLSLHRQQQPQQRKKKKGGGGPTTLTADSEDTDKAETKSEGKTRRGARE